MAGQRYSTHNTHAFHKRRDLLLRGTCELEVDRAVDPDDTDGSKGRLR